MATSEEIFREAMALPADVRVELTERLIESLAQDISPKVISEQLSEVRRRIAQVESGEVELIPGDKVLERVRSMLAQHLPSMWNEDEGITEARRRDAELEDDPSRAISLTQLDSQIQNRRD